MSAAKPIELTDGSRLVRASPIYGYGGRRTQRAPLRLVSPDGVILAEFRVEREQLQITDAKGRWVPASQRWAGLAAEVRQGVLDAFGLSR